MRQADRTTTITPHDRTHITRTDVGLSAAATLLGIADAYATRGVADFGVLAGHFDDELTTAVALGVLLLFRQRFPLTVAWAAVVGDIVAFAPFPLAVALFTVATKCRSKVWTWSTVAAATVVHTALVGVWGVDGVSRITAQLLGFVAGPVTAGMLVRTRREMAARTAEQARQRARTQERARIAREMHDVVTHQVTHMVLRAGALELTADRGSAWVAHEAAAIAQTGRRAVDELHEVLGVLTMQPCPGATTGAPGAEGATGAQAETAARAHPGDASAPAADEPDDATEGQAAETASEAATRAAATASSTPATTSAQPTLADLPDLIRSWEPVGTYATLTVTGPRHVGVPAAAQRALYRLTQEALTNAAKHAPGAAVLVRLDYQVDRLSVHLSNGPPTMARPRPQQISGSGRGLTGMREGIELLGGTFSAGRTPLRTFEIHAEIPLTTPGTAGAEEHSG
ncbi:sensor histidine kinase [Actinomycetota bacterium Odt1-20B]